MTYQKINKTMKIEEIILGFPQKALKLRRAMRNVLSCAGDLPNEFLETLLIQQGKDQVEIELFVNRLNDVLVEQVDLHNISITEKAAIEFKKFLRGTAWSPLSQSFILGRTKGDGSFIWLFLISKIKDNKLSLMGTVRQ